MEVHAKTNMTEAELKSIFNVSRKEIEGALTLMGSDGIQALQSAASQTPQPKEDKTSSKSSSDSNPDPMVSLKIKPRVQGWRDKSGRRLVARLHPPREWKIASRRAINLAKKRQAEEAANVKPKEPVKPNVLKAVASEILQSHVLVKKKQTETPKVMLLDKKKTKPEPPEATKKAPSRKRKSSTLPSTEASAVPKLTAAATELTPTTPFLDLFHIPSYKPLPTAEVAPSPHSSSKIANNDENILSRSLQLRLLQVLHNKILHPSLSPTERRTILANEISSATQRLENARNNKQLSKAQEIQKEIKALETIYKQDLEIVPEVANTLGMWQWLEQTRYFSEIKKEDICDALDSFLGSSLDNVDSSHVENGEHWGSLLPPVNVQTKNTIEQSPLFDCLQSLLVEVDDSDDEFADDELLADLPPYTMDQLLHGPDTETPDEGEEVMLDVSELSLDQRTYLQLRAVGLIDTSAIPSKSPNLVEKAPTLNYTQVDDVIRQMKSDLSKLESTNCSAASALQHVSLLDASKSLKRKKQAREEEAMLSKYRDMKKEKKEQQDTRRVSGRVKNGPNKFDGENWLQG